VEHVVFFPAPDGTPAFRRLASLDDAVRFVEHLRNVEGVSEASVHALSEVPLSFKAWYRVEVPGVNPATAAVSNGADQAASENGSERQPHTIAEAIETFADVNGIELAQLADAAGSAGSVTGIVVPDQPMSGDPFATSTPILAPPVIANAAGEQASEPADQAQVLEGAFGTRRDRGMGFFAR